MKCSKCQADNKEGAKFCGACGEKLLLICPQCNSENSPENKFCNECGQKLSLPSEPPPKDLSFDEKLNKIQRYLPKGLTEKILSQKDRIEGERKQVTIMFADMEEFTQLAERLGPERAYSIMNQVYEILIHKVHDYEGTVNEFTGDGIMALFGAPIALEDAPQRAIRSAHAIHREMSRFNDKMKEEKQDIPRLKMRIGIHTGPVVVGTLGNDLRVEFKAVGDTVNLASRMEGLAEPGSTYVTDETFKLTEGLFRFEALGEYAVKGKEEPVKTYRVIAPSTSRTRFDVSAERGLTPFVGRERELEIMLDCFESSKRGRGQVFSIMSEAGVGKSRLLYEFRKAVTNEDVTFQEGKCLSYSRGLAYHPVIDIVKSNFDIVEGNGDFEIREKLKRGLKVLGADETSTLPYLLELLSVKDSGVDSIALSPEARKDRIIKAIIRITIKASQIRPLILAIEDLHWIDRSSEDYLKDLLDSISGARVFLIFTYRPEFVHTWDAKSYHSQVNLNRLSNRESLAMVTHLLGTENIESDLEDLILEKAENVPFFIEEFVKSLKDLNIIEKKDSKYRLVRDIQEVIIPSTIQDVIMARVDILSEGAKELLQTGSVIEREFSYELIEYVSGIPELELLSRLSVLKDSELLYERGIYPESTYIFKHALTREVVYDSILSHRKKKLHDKVGQSVEKLYKDNLHEHYEILAEHFINSENYEKGAEYSKFAGKMAEKKVSLNDAIAYANKRVVSLERLLQTGDVQKKLIDARTVLGLYYIQLNLMVEAKEAVDPIFKFAIKHGYKRRLSHIYTIMGAYYSYEDDIPTAFEYLENALRIGEELNDPILAIANTFMGVARCFNCEFEKVLYYTGKALEINVSANVLWGIVAMKTHLVNNAYLPQGKISLAYETSKEALQIADESGDIYSKLHAYWVLGQSCYFKRLFDEAEEHLIMASSLAERDNIFSLAGMSNHILGETYFSMGKYMKSEKHYERAVTFFRMGRIFPSYVNLIKMLIAKAKVMRKEDDIDLREILKWHEEVKIKRCKGWMLRCVGEILLNIDDQHISEAEDWIKKSIHHHKQYKMMWDLAEDYALYAELFKRKGQKQKARENFSKAIEIFNQCGADGWVEKYEKELAAF